MRSLALALVALLMLAGAAEAKTKRFTVQRAGEGRLALTMSAPGTGWDRKGRESAVVTVKLDGRPVADVVAFMGAQRFTYRPALGRVGKGRHRVSVAFARAKSPRGARRVKVGSLRVTTTRDVVARYSPIVYGRDLPEVAGRYENNRTDVPLLAYHELRPEAGGGRTIEYTVIWSNEDGGPTRRRCWRAGAGPRTSSGSIA